MDLRRVLVALLVLLLISLSQSTLSKSGDKKEEQNTDENVDGNVEEEDERNLGGRDAILDGEEEPELVRDDKLRAEILKTYQDLDTSKSKRNFVKIAYVVPWNGNGYDVAKSTTKKYTHIAPCWFQFYPVKINNELTCDFKGEYDIDRPWLEELRTNNPDVKIVPRFTFEPTDVELFEQFLTAEPSHLKCIDKLADFLQKNQFDGVVVEFWTQIMNSVQESPMEFLIELTETFGRRLHLRELEFIVPIIPPHQSLDAKKDTYLPKEYIPRLLDSVDYLQLMTYDFVDNETDGVGPISWFKDNVELFLAENPLFSQKVLISISYSGRCEGALNDTINGDKFIEFLSDTSNNFLFWDSAVEENYLGSSKMLCYFPTSRSINLRLNLAESENLGGIAIWEVGQGNNYFSSVL